MNDLISRKALIETLEPFLEEHCSEYIKEMVIGKIKYMPVAYDLDAVVQQLEDELIFYIMLKDGDLVILGIINGLKKADRIVKAGGVTDGSQGK